MKKIKYILSTLFLGMMAASCTQDMDIDTNQGYLSLNIKSLVSTNEPSATRAAVPEGYDPKTLCVEILNEKNEVVVSTDNYADDEKFQSKIALAAGEYTIVAHSANWDGSEAAFDAPYYYGSTTVVIAPKTNQTKNIVCTLANVKISVNYDQSITDNFKSGKTTIASELQGVSALDFVMNETSKSGYIPVSSFKATLSLTNQNDVTNTLETSIDNVKARDHYIFNFKLAEDKGEGSAGIEVTVDESTNTYTFTVPVPRKSAIALQTRAANAWSTFAYLNAQVTSKTDAFEPNCLSIQWRQNGQEAWNNVPFESLAIDAEDNVTTTLKGLSPNTSYEYRLVYVNGDDEVICDPVAFTTEGQKALYNGGFEHWHQSGNPWYPNEEGVKFWDTSNPGSTSIGASYNVTTRTGSPKRSGSYAAKLESTKVIIKFAAASMYTGEFGEVKGTSGAILDWGTPFKDRPTALKGFMQYHPQAVDNVGKNLPAAAPAKGQPDICSIYIALLSDIVEVNNTDVNLLPNLLTDSRVIAYGALPDNQCVATGDSWKEVNIPLVYRDINKKPSYLLVVFSASKYGDYFHGAKGSTLYLDDFSLEYGDEPSVN